MMGAQLQLILTTCLVICGLTSVKSHSQTIDRVVLSQTRNEGGVRENFRNLFDSVAANNFGESEAYRDTLKAEVASAQHAFDSVRDELHTARSKNSFDRTHSDRQSDMRKNVKVAKRDTCAATTAATTEELHIGRLDIRAGKILSAAQHPDEKFFSEIKADVGELKPRTIIAPLQKFLPAEEIVNRTALFVLNVKRYYYTGIYNEALLLYASANLKVEVLEAPPTAQPGDIVTVNGYERKPDARVDCKKDEYATLQGNLRTNEKGEGTYKGVPFNVAGKGPAVVKTLFNTSVYGY